MDASSIERIKQLFDQLIALPAGERESWLTAQAGLDDATRRYLHGLLAADAQVGDLTAWPALRSGAPPADWLGRRIGPYEVVRELGRGGMGSVFLARRVDGGVEQQVAIKIVRPERLDASTLARFRLERQVLALLQHPNIAAMLDLGELPDGSPYAVMEYVAGTPLSQYIREQAPELRQRLELFLQLCAAVSYAHANMVVHRDLKPGNVLVDRQGRPRLLDFGIAKPLQSRLGAIEVEETAAENRFFSLAHAAPEQLREDGRIGAACDVYGLGTLLYQLLAGAPPFALDGRSYAELERDILEKDPLPPSRRVTRVHNGATTKFHIDRDLDLITLRCLRKEPADRYASVDQLAADVRNYLAGRPVAAREGNTLYRLGRFVSRHRLAVGMSAALLSIATIGAVLLWRQQLATVEQRAGTEEMTTLITDAVATLDPNSSKRDLSAREVFERVAAQTNSSPTITPASRARILAAIANIDLELGLPAQAERLINSLDLAELPGNERAKSILTRALVLQALDRDEEARQLAAEQIKLAAGTPAAAPWQLMDAELELERGNTDEALRKIDAIDRTALDPVMREQVGSARGLILLSSTDTALRESAAAEFTQLLAAQRARLGPRAPATFDTMRRLAMIDYRAGRMEKARALGQEQLALAEEVFTKDSIRYANALTSVTLNDDAPSAQPASIERFKTALSIYQAQSGEFSEMAAKTHMMLAEAYERSGNLAESEIHCVAGSTAAAKAWEPSHLNPLLFSAHCARLMLERDEIAEAAAMARTALANVERHPQLKEFDIVPLAETIANLGRYHAEPSNANREAVSNSLRRAIDEASGVTTKMALGKLTSKLKTMGIEPAAASAAPKN